jgi:hypothetical protein
MRFGKVHECQNIVLGLIHHRGQFGKLFAQLVGDDAPLRAGRFGCFLCEDGADKGQNHLALPFAGIGQGVAHEMHAATLPRRFEYLGDRGFEAGVRVGNHEFHAA